MSVPEQEPKKPREAKLLLPDAREEHQSVPPVVSPRLRRPGYDPVLPFHQVDRVECRVPGVVVVYAVVAQQEYVRGPHPPWPPERQVLVRVPEVERPSF